MITIPGLRIMYVRLFQLETGVFALADPGEGAGGPGPPSLFFDQNEDRDRFHPSLRVWMAGGGGGGGGVDRAPPPPPLI